MELLDGAIREAEWGSPSAIPQLLGRPETGRPVAELWLGAHPSAPARVAPSGEPLDQLIAADRAGTLGAEAARRFGDLPFLFKVLAAEAPLSLQAHPSTVQAEAGFAREESEGIPIDAPERFYRDRHHKPELICALSDFHALCGFREPLATQAVLDTVATPALDPMRAQLLDDPSPASLAALLEWLLSLPDDDAASLVDRVAVACRRDGPPEAAAERTVVADLATRYPRDPAVVVALLLNLVVLAPGDALFLGPGNLHAYLHGTAVELMANSDNVVRGGLTTKPVDVPALLGIVDCSPIVPQVQRPALAEGIARYHAPVPEFSLTRREVDGPHEMPTGAAIVLCTEGDVRAGPHRLGPGTALWISAADPPVVLDGTGTVFVAAVGDLTST